MKVNSAITNGHDADAFRRDRVYLAEAQRLSQTGSFGWNVLTGEPFWSEETFRIFEYDPTVTPIISLVLERVHPDDRDSVQKAIDLASSGRATVDLEHRLLMPDGVVKFIHVVARASENDAGGLEYIGAVTDITATRHAELQLRRSEESLRLALEVMPGLVWTMLPNLEASTIFRRRHRQMLAKRERQMSLA